MKGFISGCVVATMIIGIGLAKYGLISVDPEDIKDSASICEFRGGLAPIETFPGAQVYYYCNDGYRALPAPDGEQFSIRHEFETYVAKEGLDLHLEFTDEKYSNGSTMAAFEIFCAGAEVE